MQQNVMCRVDCLRLDTAVMDRTDTELHVLTVISVQLQTLALPEAAVLVS